MLYRGVLKDQIASLFSIFPFIGFIIPPDLHKIKSTVISGT